MTGHGLSPGGAQVAERIRAAAATGRDGVLQVVGDPGGLVYLAGGRVLLAQTWAAPGVDLLVLHRTRDRQGRHELLAAVGSSEGRDSVAAQARRLLQSGGVPPVELDVVRQQAVADAAFALLATDGTTMVRTRFFRGERPWTQLSDPVPVDTLTAEAARRRQALVTLESTVGPRSPVRRARRLPVPAVRLTPARWDLVVHADGTRTPADLAWLLGRGLFATTLEVSRLERLGLLEPTGGAGMADRHG